MCENKEEQALDVGWWGLGRETTAEVKLRQLSVSPCLAQGPDIIAFVPAASCLDTSCAVLGACY